MNRLAHPLALKRSLAAAFAVGTLLLSGSALLAQDNTPSTTDTQAVVQATPPTLPDGSAPNGAPPDGAASGSSTTNPVLSATCGAYTLDGETATSTGQTYDSTADDQSSICAINGASLTVSNVTITKTGDSSSSDQSSFYGLNAAVLAGSGSSLTMDGGTVTTSGAGTNGIFSTGEGTTVTVADVTIDAHGDGAHGVMATLGGAMTLTNVDMNTTGAHSAAIATDRGSGTITATGGAVTTSGDGSPGIYSTGAITVSGSTFTSTGSEVAVIEGANSITLTDSSLTSTYEDFRAVMLYQSFSGDAEGSEGEFTMTGGSLAYTAKSGSMFYVTNATGTINLKNVSLTATSGTLLEAAADQWGTDGANGGSAILIADTQALTGDVIADDVSTVTVTLRNTSTLTGAINSANTAQSADLTLDASSTWNVTGDSHLSTLTDPDGISGTAITNIVGNGHTVTYDASLEANAALNGQTYSLANGGQLTPQ